MVPDVVSSTYIPSLERYLPHSWADPSLVSTKAAKSDDAAVAFATWNQRILLVVLTRVDPHPTQVRRPPPSQTQALDRLRQLFQQKQRRLIYLDFRLFMHLEYGSDWALTLWSARQLQRIRVASSDPPAPKRYKGGVGVGVGVGGSSSLLADAAQGAAALRSITHSTWWEWNLGSTLLFWRWGTALPRQHARDGIPICVMGELQKAPSQQRAPSSSRLEWRSLVLSCQGHRTPRVATPKTQDILDDVISILLSRQPPYPREREGCHGSSAPRHAHQHPSHRH
jgi:hypothetical protein